MFLFCNLVYVYKMCVEMFGGCRLSFSWLGQKVKRIRSLSSSEMCVNVMHFWIRNITITWSTITRALLPITAMIVYTSVGKSVFN